MAGFALADYIIFCGSLLFSLLIGIYHAFKDRHGTADDYFLAGRNQGILPVALSITATCISAVTCLGFPTEVFKRGFSIMGFAVGSCFGVLGAAFFTVPVFFPLRFTSIYEYLEKRFRSKIVRRIAVFSFIIMTLFYMGVCLYGPAVALNSVTPLSTSASILLCGVICTVYTSIGGMKSVLWTDVLQSVLIFGGQISVLVLGVAKAGGMSNIIKINQLTGRLTQHLVPRSFWTLDPTVAHTIWSTLIGASFLWMMQISSSQNVTQRVMCLPTTRKAVITVSLAAPLYFLIMSISMLCGLILTATYVLCDPIKTRSIKNPNEYLPFLVAESFSEMPGLTGLFVSAVFSSSLSSISSGINAIAAVIWEDILFEFTYFKSIEVPTLVMKLLSILTGTFSIGIAFLAMYSGGNVFTIGIKFQSCIAGALYAIFLSAYFLKFITPRGVLAGWAVALALCSWIVIGSALHPIKQELPSFNDTAFCADRSGVFDNNNNNNNNNNNRDNNNYNNNNNITYFSHQELFPLGRFQKKYSEEMKIWQNRSADIDLNAEKWSGLGIYKLSYLFVNPLGAIAFIIVASIVSLLDGGREFADKVDKRYLFSVDKLRNGLVNLHVGVNTEDDDDENHPVKPKAIWAGEGD